MNPAASTGRVKLHRARLRQRKSQPERGFLEMVVKWVDLMRKRGLADAATGRIGILAAELMALSDAQPKEQSGWEKFAVERGLVRAIVSTPNTLRRRMAIDAMQQAADELSKDMAREAGSELNQADLRAGLAAAKVLVRDRPILDMHMITDWLARDLMGGPDGYLAPPELRL
jgi:hypothetical protein